MAYRNMRSLCVHATGQRHCQAAIPSDALKKRPGAQAFLTQSGRAPQPSIEYCVPGITRAGDPSFDIPLDIVAMRPHRPLSRPAESLWRLLGEEGEMFATAATASVPRLHAAAS